MDYELRGLGATIVALRSEMGWTQQQLADVSGVSAGQIRRIEAGQTRSPQVLTLAALARALGVSLVGMLTRVDTVPVEVER